VSADSAAMEPADEPELERPEAREHEDEPELEALEALGIPEFRELALEGPEEDELELEALEDLGTPEVTAAVIEEPEEIPEGRRHGI
jgi:hypothetical protein